MRRIIFYEGKVLVGHECIIRPGAVDIGAKDVIPVFVNFNYQDPAIAWASKPELDPETGAVSFEIEWVNPDPRDRAHFEDEELYGFSMYLQNVVMNKKPEGADGYDIMEDATLRAISIIDHKIEWREP